jgi:acyl-coenzyme A synthetase/AMP-(fatty) acid ligase
MSLWGMLSSGTGPPGALVGRSGSIPISDFACCSCLGGGLELLRGRSVIIVARDPVVAALAMVELDGVARRLVLCPPDLAPEHLPSVIRDAEVEAWVGDDPAHRDEATRLGISCAVFAQPILVESAIRRLDSHESEWILFTSGTTGAPKLVVHSLSSLMSAIALSTRAHLDPTIWSTFYDIRRYGGLQILFRGLLGGSLVLASPDETLAEFLDRAGRAGITHISGTPSHWRKALINDAGARISPRVVRLSGEIADQAILDALHVTFPGAAVGHAFASTESGVGFEVSDGLAGFPEQWVGTTLGNVEIELREGTLHLRSPGNARGYLAHEGSALKGPDGFVDTGDLLERRDGRYLFTGRRGGVINVGGLKVHPEEVEAVINRHPWVRVSLVKARRSPITGAVVAADVVLYSRPDADPPTEEALRGEIFALCHASLAKHKVPISLRIVADLPVSAAGKLLRPNA